MNVRKLKSSLFLYLAYFASIALAGVGTWATVQSFRHGFPYFLERWDWVSEWGCLIAAPLAAACLMIVRNRTDKRRPLIIASVAWGACVVVAVSLLGQYPARPKYHFIPEGSFLFSSNPGVPGFLEVDYTYSAKPLDVVKVANEELEFFGLVRERSKRALPAEFRGRPIPDKVFPDRMVFISPGRATGKHFSIDGDFLEIGQEEDWVTISIVYVDPLPLLIRAFVY